MISQKRMKEWIPEALESFKAVMPPIDIPYPEIIIVSPITAERIRTETVNRLQSPQRNAGVEYSVMETIHGELGDAIIIYQKNVPENPYNQDREETNFQHVLWHELGHFYSAYAECPGEELFRYMDQKPRSGIEAMKQIGYWLWTEFIAEVIACHIDPDVEIKWDQYNWYGIRNDIFRNLMESFNRYPDSVDEYALGHYFAGILANKSMVSFLEAAEDGRARANGHLGYGGKTVTLAEAGIDPKCRSAVEEEYRPLLNDLEKLLKEQLTKEPYWRIEPDFLIQINRFTSQMSTIKAMNCATDQFGDVIQRLAGEQGLD